MYGCLATTLVLLVCVVDLHDLEVTRWASVLTRTGPPLEASAATDASPILSLFLSWRWMTASPPRWQYCDALLMAPLLRMIKYLNIPTAITDYYCTTNTHVGLYEGIY